MRLHELTNDRAGVLSAGGILKASEARLPPDERRQVLHLQANHASIPGIKGGQDRSGREIEAGGDRLAVILVVGVLLVLAGLAARVLG